MILANLLLHQAVLRAFDCQVTERANATDNLLFCFFISSSGVGKKETKKKKVKLKTEVCLPVFYGLSFSASAFVCTPLYHTLVKAKKKRKRKKSPASVRRLLVLSFFFFSGLVCLFSFLVAANVVLYWWHCLNIKKCERERRKKEKQGTRSGECCPDSCQSARFPLT